MQIRRIRAFRVELPLHEGSYRWSGGKSVSVFDSTVVQVETDTGLVGHGEVCPLGPFYLPAYAAGVRDLVADSSEGSGRCGFRQRCASGRAQPHRRALEVRHPRDRIDRVLRQEVRRRVARVSALGSPLERLAALDRDERALLIEEEARKLSAGA